MTAEEQRKQVKALYETILGRNYYSQNSVKRQCVYHPYSNGLYYSDCSSSILNTYFEAGVLDWHEGNTATIHYQAALADVVILDGVPDESALRIGDLLMFRRNDPSRPEQIGHVEMYAGNGVIYGHGSDTPSSKNLVSYCEYWQKQKANNGKSKGLVEVRRFIPDDAAEIPVEAALIATAALNVRTAPNIQAPIVGVIPAGYGANFTAKCNRWFYAPAKGGWCSASYLTGWVKESGRWWYLQPGYTYPAHTVTEINGKEYCFDRDGWLIESQDIDVNGAVKY